MNVLEYSEALDKLLIEMEKISEPYSWEIQSILEDVCESLRIGKIELFSYESVRHEEVGNGEMLTYYLKDTPEGNEAYLGRHISARGTILIFKFYQKQSDSAWSDDELSKIKVLDAVLYTYNAKIRLTKFAEGAFYYDRQLHIPNTSYFQKELLKLMAEDQFQNYAICYFNLKRFAAINQLLGRELGTKVMAQFIVGLQQKLRKKGTICRIAGDNFIMFFEKSEVDLVSSYLSSTEVIYNNIGNESVIVKASGGIYISTGELENVDEATEKARIALQIARQLTNNTVVVYTEDLKYNHEYASMVESVFREAIGREEFQVYYQPKIQLNDYTIAGAEALCRWRHEGKFIYPDDFIPILEQSNSICTLDFYMLEHVCKAIHSWLDRNLNVVRVSVNLSRRHLGDNRLLEKILEIVDKYEVPHQYIEIEFTETTTEIAFNDLKKIVNDLRAHGIHTSIDDFGVGSSSLNLIRQISWDVIKIDKSFLPDVSDKTSPQHLLFSHLLSMFRELGLKCIVEGVETIEQVKMLKDNMCFLAQGYFFDNPLSLEEFETRLSN